MVVMLCTPPFMMLPACFYLYYTLCFRRLLSLHTLVMPQLLPYPFLQLSISTIRTHTTATACI